MHQVNIYNIYILKLNIFTCKQLQSVLHLHRKSPGRFCRLQPLNYITWMVKLITLHEVKPKVAADFAILGRHL